jgi:RNA polymerase sigma factor (sigma-70 family)
MAATAHALGNDAIEDLYRTHGQAVRRRALSVLNDEAEAEDAVQEVFIRAIRYGDNFRAAASPRTWLYRVTMNYCLNVKRNGSRHRRLLEEKVFPAMTGPSAGYDDRIAARTLMTRMPVPVREVAACFYVGGMTQDETAVELGVSRRTVGNRLKTFRDLALV